MKNNILGGLVIFFVVVTCLIMIDDISNTNEAPSNYQVEVVETQEDNHTDLAVTDIEGEE